MSEQNALIILAIDPGTGHTGWCVGQGDRYLNSGVLRLCGPDVWGRLNDLRGQLGELLEKYDPDVVFCELPAGDHGNRHTDRVLGAALGVVLTLAGASGCRFETVRPATVKATGASKDTPGRAALVVGKASVTADEADAIGVWLAALGSQAEIEMLKWALGFLPEGSK